jgi:hypothetical protein
MTPLEKYREQNPQLAEVSDQELASALYEDQYAAKMSRRDFYGKLGLSGEANTAGFWTGLRKLPQSVVPFGDEAAGAGAFLGRGTRSLIEGRGLEGSYEDALTAMRRRIEEARAQGRNFFQDYPAVAYPLSVAAGFGVMGPRGAATAGGFGAVPSNLPEVTRGFWSNVGRNVGEGAAIGGLYGAGAGEGGFGERANAAVTGAALGGGFGAAVPVGWRAGEVVWNRMRNMLGVGKEWASKQAAQKVFEALQKDGMSVDDAANALRQWRDAGAKPAALFDIGGQNMRRLARATAGTPSSKAGQIADEFLSARKGAQGDRIAGDLAKFMDASDFFTMMDDVVARQKAKAAPLYDKAYATPLYDNQTGGAFVHTDETNILQKIMGRPVIKTAISRARNLARNEGYTLGKDLDVRGWDYVKRGLDDMINLETDPITGKITNRGRIYADNRRLVLGEVDKLSPAYKEARATFAGEADILSAMNMGRKLFSGDDLAMSFANKKIAAMGPSEKEAFRVGVTQAIKERASRTPDGANIVRRFFNDPNKRARIESAFDDTNQFQAFQDAMKREMDLYDAGQFVSPNTGSQTQLRQADAGALADDVMADVVLGTAQTGSPIAGATNAGYRLVARGMQPSVQFPAKVADEIAPRMFTGDYSANMAALDWTRGGQASLVEDALRRYNAYKLGTYAPTIGLAPHAGGLID